MAEFVFKDMVEKAGLSRKIRNCFSGDEPGGDWQSGTSGDRRKLEPMGISTSGKYAVQARKEDYAFYDYLIGMDTWNIRNMQRIFDVTRTIRFTG